MDKGNRFILVEKRQKDANDDDYDPVVPYYYAPLLDDCDSLYPDIKVLLRTNCVTKQSIVASGGTRIIEQAGPVAGPKLVW